MGARVLRLFVDPGSKSAGWALYKDDVCVEHGTWGASKGPPFERLAEILSKVERELHHWQPAHRIRIEEAHIETLNYGTSYICIWSVGVIGAMLQIWGIQVAQDIPIKSWQKHANWAEEKKDWAAHGCSSEDEFAAVCMGRWYMAEKVGK